MYVCVACVLLSISYLLLLRFLEPVRFLQRQSEEDMVVVLCANIERKGNVTPSKQ